ncbi:hypothetical protein HK101_006391 [Irineochytrium annulatum]|nr:hypothetical protein HK101_006391 [Irineochytrium annulatum]
MSNNAMPYFYHPTTTSAPGYRQSAEFSYISAVHYTNTAISPTSPTQAAAVASPGRHHSFTAASAFSQRYPAYSDMAPNFSTMRLQMELQASYSGADYLGEFTGVEGGEGGVIGWEQGPEASVEELEAMAFYRDAQNLFDGRYSPPADGIQRYNSVSSQDSRGKRVSLGWPGSRRVSHADWSKRSHFNPNDEDDEDDSDYMDDSESEEEEDDEQVKEEDDYDLEQLLLQQLHFDPDHQVADAEVVSEGVEEEEDDDSVEDPEIDMFERELDGEMDDREGENMVSHPWFSPKSGPVAAFRDVGGDSERFELCEEDGDDQVYPTTPVAVEPLSPPPSAVRVAPTPINPRASMLPSTTMCPLQTSQTSAFPPSPSTPTHSPNSITLKPIRAPISVTIPNSSSPHQTPITASSTLASASVSGSTVAASLSNLQAPAQTRRLSLMLLTLPESHLFPVSNVTNARYTPALTAIEDLRRASAIARTSKNGILPPASLHALHAAAVLHHPASHPSPSPSGSIGGMAATGRMNPTASVIAMYLLALCLIDGVGCRKDPALGVALLERTAGLAGSVRPAGSLPRGFGDRGGVEKKMRKKSIWGKKAREEKDTKKEAGGVLGLKFRRGSRNDSSMNVDLPATPVSTSTQQSGARAQPASDDEDISLFPHLHSINPGAAPRRQRAATQSDASPPTAAGVLVPLTVLQSSGTSSAQVVSPVGSPQTPQPWMKRLNVRKSKMPVGAAGVHEGVAMARIGTGGSGSNESGEEVAKGGAGGAHGKKGLRTLLKKAAEADGGHEGKDGRKRMGKGKKERHERKGKRAEGAPTSINLKAEAQPATAPGETERYSKMMTPSAWNLVDVLTQTMHPPPPVPTLLSPAPRRPSMVDAKAPSPAPSGVTSIQTMTSGADNGPSPTDGSGFNASEASRPYISARGSRSSTSAADAGLAMSDLLRLASTRLGECFDQGIGVDRSDAAAAYYYRVAGTLGRSLERGATRGGGGKEKEKEKGKHRHQHHHHHAERGPLAIAAAVVKSGSGTDGVLDVALAGFDGDGAKAKEERVRRLRRREEKERGREAAKRKADILSAVRL